MHIKIITTYLPSKTLSTVELSEQHPKWNVEKIGEKTGIKIRHIANEDEYVSDMGTLASEKMFSQGVDRTSIDYLILCTQSPDYLLPSTACLIQEKLRLKTSIGAIDVNLGCSGYIYALSLAHGLIESQQVKNVLIITADTYTKFIDKEDKTLVTLFGDAASATLVAPSGKNARKPIFLFGTNGEGAENLILKNSGLKKDHSNPHLLPKLYMNGPEIINFALTAVPEIYHRLLSENKISSDEIKYFVFHQANKFILENLKNKLCIDDKKFVIDMENTGNTVSSTIPITLSKLMNSKKLEKNDLILLLGFGVGYSLAASLISIH